VIGMEDHERNYDPVRSAWTNSPSVTAVFLKNGESLRPIQRAGVIVISLMVVANGVYFGFDAYDAIRSGSPTELFFAALAVFLLAMGGLGLRNALRFKPRDPSE
jgi:hypothetical protein